MNKKIIFYLAIITISILSTLTIASLFYSFYLVIEGSDQAQEVLTNASVYLFFLRFTGTLAFIFIGIATALGALRNWIFSFYKNTAFWKIHTRWASSIGIGLATAHLTIYLLYEYRLKVPLTLKLFTPNFAKLTTMNTLVFFSLTALIIFTINMILAHIPGVQAKKWWKPLHIFNFIGFFLVVFHAYFIGSNSSDPLYMSLYAVFLVLALSGAFIRFFTQIKKMKNGKPIPSPATPTLASQSQPTNPSKKPASPTTVPLHDEQFNVVKGRE